jgi:glycine hydroxymethyltransferase
VLDIRPLGLNGTKASRMLDAAHITISKSTLPFDTEKIMHGGGIRIGTPAITTRGMLEADMETVADFMDRTLRGADPETIKLEVKAFVNRFILP